MKFAYSSPAPVRSLHRALVIYVAISKSGSDQCMELPAQIVLVSRIAFGAYLHGLSQWRVGIVPVDRFAAVIER